MSKLPNPDQAELHAFVDGLLNPERERQIKQFLTTNDAARVQVEEWSAQNKVIDRLFNQIETEEIPERLNPVAIANRLAEAKTPNAANNNSGWPNWRSITAAAVIALISANIGWFANRSFDSQNTIQTDPTLGVQLANNALRAHATYVVEVAHPVDVTSSKQDHLVSWLSKRLGGKIGAPKLSSHGYSLVGGNLLPAGEGPAAQFMYENNSGERITLYATKNNANKLAAFQFASQDALNAFYWIDTDFSYVLSGEITREKLREIAILIYKQLE